MEKFTIKVDFCQTERETIKARPVADILAEWYADYYRKLGATIVSYGSTPIEEKNIIIKLKSI